MWQRLHSANIVCSLDLQFPLIRDLLALNESWMRWQSFPSTNAILKCADLVSEDPVGHRAWMLL